MPEDIRVVENVTIDLERAQGRLRNLRPVFMGPVLDDLLATEAAIFANAGGVAGTDKWEPLADSTLNRKTRNARSTRIMVDRGDLERSLIERGAEGQVARMVGPATFEFGTEVTNDRGEQFAIYHQLGTRTMPARQVVPDEWPDEDVERWGDIAVEYVMEGRL